MGKGTIVLPVRQRICEVAIALAKATRELPGQALALLALSRARRAGMPRDTSSGLAPVSSHTQLAGSQPLTHTYVS